jgi:hypothetical protein
LTFVNNIKLMKISKIKLSLLLLTWFSMASVAIFGLASASKSHFDPKLKLSQGLMSLSFEKNLTKALTKISGPIRSPAIYHITQGNCYCEFLVSAHQSKLNRWSLAEGFVNVAINLSQFPEIAEFIPSTPAVIAISKYGSLLYLGPYSRGTGCFASNGQVDSFLRDYVSRSTDNTNYQSTIIETDASGCYCET